MKTKSKIIEKKENVVDAVYELIDEVMELPVVKKVLSIMLSTLLVIGFIGLSFLVLFLIFFLGGKDGIAGWIFDFVRAFPVISSIWFVISFFVGWLIGKALQELEKKTT